MPKRKKVRIIETSVAERFKNPGLTNYRVEMLAPGIDYFTVAGFPTIEEAKAYRRQLRAPHWCNPGCKWNECPYDA